MFIRVLSSLLILFSLNAGADSNSVATSFLVLGDSGYHYDYLKPKVKNNPTTPDEYVADELKSWKKKHLPIAEFKPAPMYMIPNTKYAIEASGAKPVGQAMDTYCKSNSCNFAIMLGDNIYPNGATGRDDEIRFKKIFEEPFRDLINNHKSFKMYGALGNHDWKTSRIGRNRQIEYGMRAGTAFTMQAPGYYSFKRGAVEFFVIDTNLLLSGSIVKENALNPDGSEKPVDELDSPEKWEVPNQADLQQLSWLENALRKSTAKWKIVYGHHTLWSAGGTKFEQAKVMRKLISPMICQYADLYLAGHEHEMEVNIDTCAKELGTSNYPLPLVINGAGSWQRPVHHPFQTHQEILYPQYKAIWSKGMVWGFSHIAISNERMTIKMITTPDSGNGQVKIEKVISFTNRSQLIKNSLEL